MPFFNLFVGIMRLLKKLSDKNFPYFGSIYYYEDDSYDGLKIKKICRLLETSLGFFVLVMVCFW